MTRREYMTELAARLKEYPAPFREEVLENFESHFAEGAARGQSEEDVIRELGSVEEVADYVRQVTEGEAPEPGRGADHPFAYGHEDVAWEEVRTENSTGPRSWEGTIETTAPRLFIDCVRSSVDVEAVPGTNVTYRMKEGAGYVFVTGILKTIDDVFGTRTAQRAPAAGGQTGNVRFTTNGEETRIRAENCSGKLVVTVPPFISELKVSGMSGDMRVEKLDLRRAELAAVSGDITAADLSVQTLVCETSSGDVRLKEVTADTLDVHTSGGDISLSRVSGDAMIRASAGDVDVSDHSGLMLSVRTSAGDVEADTTAEDVKVSTSAGDVELTMNRVRRAEAVSSAGDVVCRVGSADFTAELTTSMGDLENETPLPSRMVGRVLTVGEGSGRILLKSKLGDVTLKLED